MAIQAQMYSESLGFCYGKNFGLDDSNYNIQQKHQQQLMQQYKLQQQQQQHQVHQMQGVSTVKVSNNNNNGHCRSNLDNIIENNQEILQFYNSQSENLRLMIQEQRKREISMFMQKVEMKVMALLKQKDEEIVKVSQRVNELQNFIRKLEIENQAWQRVANDNEAVIMNLNNTIEQVKENNLYAFNFNNAIEEVESCCVQNIDNKETKDENNETSERRMVCRSCDSHDSCVLFLPCRHLSSCQSCEPFLNSCPVCYMTKSCTIEVLMS